MFDGALGAGQQVLAVVGVEEFPERLDAADDHQEIVLTFERKHRVDEIVPRALFAELDFQAVGEEGEEVDDHCARNALYAAVQSSARPAIWRALSAKAFREARHAIQAAERSWRAIPSNFEQRSSQSKEMQD